MSVVCQYCGSILDVADPTFQLSSLLSYFKEVSEEACKEQYVVPYFISGFPGTTHE